MEPTAHVTSSDGVKIATYVSGAENSPTIVAVHGYPDSAAVWAPVAEVLASTYRVVRYDVRGTGQSYKPTGRAPYRLDQLRADFTAVLDRHSPDRPVHLVGHDWGSVQGWHFATSASLQDRIKGFSSISGPSLAHARPWLRAHLRSDRASLAELVRQLGHSYYLLAFQLPKLPELGWRSGLIDKLLGGGEPTASSPRSMADKINGLQLYRANLINAHPGRPGTDLPVQVLAPTGDPFISVAFQTQAPVPFVPNLSTRTVRGGHWILLDQPDLVASWIADFVG